jgi:hypothetical protein
MPDESSSAGRQLPGPPVTRDEVTPGWWELTQPTKEGPWRHVVKVAYVPPWRTSLSYMPGPEHGGRYSLDMAGDARWRRLGDPGDPRPELPEEEQHE